MAQIIASPTDLFTLPQAPVGALLPRQINPALPVPAGTASATGMLLPQQDLGQMLAHFPEGLYDLRSTSHLVRLMAVLLGDAGVGQLRKRQLVVQLASTLTGSAWLDQDRFYGAIFSMGRTPGEHLDIDPADSVATVEEWEELEAADASYRERLIALAASIPLAGTVPGLIAAAEAIIGAPVEAIETWQALDASSGISGRTWGQVEALGTWGNLNNRPWFTLESIFTVGLSGVDSRAEVVLRPHKDYTSDRAGQIQAAADARALVEVLSKLAPDGILITVDTAMAAPGVPVPCASVWADSAYTEVCPKVTPAASAPDGVYPLSPMQVTAGTLASTPRFLPRPPGVRVSGSRWDYNADITSVSSYTMTVPDDTPPGTPGNAAPNAGADDQVLTWRDGTTTVFAAADAVAAPAVAATARLGSPGVLVAHPYSGARKVVPVHG